MQTPLRALSRKIFVLFFIIATLSLNALQNAMAKEASLVLQESFGSDPYQYIVPHNDLIIASSNNGGFTNVGGTSIDILQYTSDGFTLVDQHFFTLLSTSNSPNETVIAIDYMAEINGVLSFILATNTSSKFLVTASISANSLSIIDTQLISRFNAYPIKTDGDNNRIYIVDDTNTLVLDGYEIDANGDISFVATNDIDDLFDRTSIYGLEGLLASFDDNSIYIVSTQNNANAKFYQLELDSNGTIAVTRELSLPDTQEEYFHISAKDGLLYLSPALSAIEVVEVQGDNLVRLFTDNSFPILSTVIISGDYALLMGFFSYTVVLDIADKANIIKRDERFSDDVISDAFLQNNTLFLSRGTGGISTLNISDSGLLLEGQSFAQSGIVIDFSTLNGTLANVAGNNAIHLWEINNQQDSELTTRFFQENGVSGVHLLEDELLLINSSNVEKHQLDNVRMQIDASNIIGSLPSSGAEGRIIALENGYVAEAYEFLKFFNLEFEEVGEYELPREQLSAYFKQYSFAVDNRLYVPTNNPNIVFIFDTSDIENVALLSQNISDFPFTMKKNVATKGDILYLPSSVNGRVAIEVIDIGEANAFSRVNLLDIEEIDNTGVFVTAATVHIYEDYLVVLGKSAFLYDISDPRNPSLIDTNPEISSNGYAQMFDNSLYSVRSLTSGNILRSHINLAPQLPDSQVQLQEDLINENNNLSLPLNDQEGDSIAYEVLENNDLVNASISNTNTLTLVGKPNLFGQTQLLVQATDEHGNIGEIKIIINIEAVNDAPDIALANNTIIQNEDTVSVTPLNPMDLEGDAFTIEITAPAMFGSAEITDGNELRYLPNTHYFGDDSVEISITDEHGAETIRRLPITILPVNDLPILSGLDSLEASEDSNIQFVLNAEDAENQPVTFTLSSAPNNWTVTVSGSEISIVPAENDNGDFTLVFTLSDGVDTNQQEFVLNLLPQNDTPQIEALTISVNEDTNFISSLNVTDVEGDTTSLEIVTPPAFGNAELRENDVLSYIPNLDYFGTDSVELSVTDSNGAQSTLIIPINIVPVNDLPTLATELRVDGTEDTAFTIELDASDVENDPISFTVASNPDDWTVTIEDNVATVTPALNDDGLFELAFNLSDGRGNNVQTFSINLASQNDAPSVEQSAISTSVIQGSNVSGSVNASDADNDTLNFQISTQASKGTASVDSQGNYSYAANGNEVGADSFVVSVSDSAGETVSVTVSLNIAQPPISIPPESQGGGGASSPLALLALLLLICFGRRTTHAK